MLSGQKNMLYYMDSIPDTDVQAKYTLEFLLTDKT